MTSGKAKALFIGNHDTWSALQKTMRPEWDWQQPIDNVSVFAAWLRGEDVKMPFEISEDTSIIVISTEFYKAGLNPKPQYAKLRDDFLAAVAYSSSETMCMVLNYWPELQKRIQQDIVMWGQDHRSEDVTIGKYYWVQSSRPNAYIDRAITEYLSDPESDPTAKMVVAESEGLQLPSATPEAQPAEVEPAPGEFSDYMTEDTGSKPFTNSFGRNALIVASTSTKGGVGKTTMAMLTGTWFVRSSDLAMRNGSLKQPLKVCIVDLDMKDTQIATMLNLTAQSAKKNVMRIIGSPVFTDKTVADNLVYDKRMKCWFLLGPKQASNAASIKPSKYAQIFGVLQRMFDIVIMDTSAAPMGVKLFSDVVYPMANEIMFITSLDRRSVVGMSKWIIAEGSPKEHGGNGIALDKMKIVINVNNGSDVEMTAEEIQNSIKFPLVTVYGKFPTKMAEEEWKKPQLVGVVKYMGSTITKWSNLQEMPMALNTPTLERSVANICRSLVPKSLADILPNIEKVE